MCRLLGFIFFWIAVGMIITLFIMDNVFLCVCIIITLLVVGYNMSVAGTIYCGYEKNLMKIL